MNLFEINFISKMSALLNEAFKFKKYKAMHPAYAVFVGIFMLPVVIISFAVTAVLAILTFAFEVFSTPVKYIHGIVNNEGKEVKHATQAIVYLISWPLIFVSYALMGLALLVIFPIYALFSFLAYVWTLGGFKFHLFPVEDDISIEVNSSYCVLPLVFIAASALIVVVAPFVHGVIYYAELYKICEEQYFVYDFFGGIYFIYIGAQFAFATLYSLIGLAPYPKAKAVTAAVNEAEEAEETVEEV